MFRINLKNIECSWNDVLNCARKFLQCKRFRQKVNIVQTFKLVPKFGFSISGHTNHRQVRAEPPRFCDETRAVQFRHDDIGDEQVNIVRLPLLEKLERSAAGGCFNHPIALAAQRPCAKQAHRVLILHQHDGANARQVQRFGGDWASNINHLRRMGRQIEGERCTGPEFAIPGVIEEPNLMA